MPPRQRCAAPASRESGRGEIERERERDREREECVSVLPRATGAAASLLWDIAPFLVFFFPALFSICSHWCTVRLTSAGVRDGLLGWLACMRLSLSSCFVAFAALPFMLQLLFWLERGLETLLVLSVCQRWRVPRWCLTHPTPLCVPSLHKLHVALRSRTPFHLPSSSLRGFILPSCFLLTCPACAPRRTSFLLACVLYCKT